jgi:hypothetical protein
MVMAIVLVQFAIASLATLVFLVITVSFDTYMAASFSSLHNVCDLAKRLLILVL